MSQEKGATPPGTIARDYVDLPTVNAYQTVFDITDPNGLLAQAELTNPVSGEDVYYRMTTKDLFGTETISADTDLPDTGLTKVEPANRFVTRFKLEVKSKVADVPSTIQVKVRAITVGAAVIADLVS